MAEIINIGENAGIKNKCGCMMVKGLSNSDPKKEKEKMIHCIVVRCMRCLWLQRYSNKVKLAMPWCEKMDGQVKQR